MTRKIFMSNRLPETDLANWAFLSHDKKRVALERHNAPKRVEGTYEPFRVVFGDAINVQSPLYAEEGREQTPWPTIEQQIRRRCRTKPESLQMNLDLAKATYVHAEQHRLVAVPIDVTSLSFGVGHLYQFGLPLLIRYNDRVVAVFIDARRKGLSIPARDWVFSAMHERFRAAYPDLAEIGLEIWRYADNAERTLQVLSASVPRYSFGVLSHDVRETYELYHAVLRGDRDRKRRSGGGAGPLYD
jgi:hypothetical protein